MLRVPDCVRDGIRPGVPEATESQRIRNEIEVALVMARAYFVNLHLLFFQNANEREHKTRLRCIHREQVRLPGTFFYSNAI